MRDKQLRNQARALRKSMTPEELRLWHNLRQLNKAGHHFRRQSPVDGYILDFAEFRHRIIIEVDGGQHNMPEHEKHDARRDAHFTAAGFRILRFWNNDVRENIEGVMGAIWQALALPPPAAQTRGTLPTEGEGEVTL